MSRRLVDRESVAFLGQTPGENVLDFCQRILHRAEVLDRAETRVGTVVLICGESTCPDAVASRCRLARHLTMVLAEQPASRLVLASGVANEPSAAHLLEMAGAVLEVLEGADLSVEVVTRSRGLQTGLAQPV